MYRVLHSLSTTATLTYTTGLKGLKATFHGSGEPKKSLLMEKSLMISTLSLTTRTLTSEFDSRAAVVRLTHDYATGYKVDDEGDIHYTQPSESLFGWSALANDTLTVGPGSNLPRH